MVLKKINTFNNTEYARYFINGVCVLEVEDTCAAHAQGDTIVIGSGYYTVQNVVSYPELCIEEFHLSKD